VTGRAKDAAFADEVPPLGSGVGEILLDIRGLRIEGLSDNVWHEIVRDVDLTLRRGEVLGLIGESGAGKSSLGLAAMGYARPGCRISKGTILFDGIDLARLRETEKRDIWGRRIGHVAQSAAASFNPASRLLHQCAEAPIWHQVSSTRAAARRVIELFQRLRLPDSEKIGDCYPHQVSGGQLQRAMTAMAMSCAPDLMIFDEPTTALDVTTQIDVLFAIREVVRHARVAAIYISHDLAVVAQLADRIMVLWHGTVVDEAPTRQMLSNSRHPYTRSLWAVRTLHWPERMAEAVQLRVDHVDAGYRGVNVLHDLELTVPRGRTVALVGESGSGKSTLARVITGLLPASKGTILFDGKPLPPALSDRTTELLRRIQMIYQMPDTALNPGRRVRDILGRPLKHLVGLKGAAHERRLLELLNMVDLDKQFLDRVPAQLSGGQKQRICIARALAVEPDLIICDEVTSALDQIVAEEVLKLLMRLQREFEISYLYITHDLTTVKAIADEVVVMLDGRAVQSGRRSQVLMPPHHPYTAKLLSSVPEMDPDWLDRVLDKRRRSM
jgi:peptide/nickel transport system ATP-binding protein